MGKDTPKPDDEVPKALPVTLRGKPKVLKRRGAKPLTIRKVGRNIEIEGLDDFDGFGAHRDTKSS